MYRFFRKLDRVSKQGKLFSHYKDIHLTSNNTDRIFFLEVDTPMIHGYKVTFRDILDSKDRYSLVSTVYQGLDRCELFMFCWLLGC